MANRDGTLAFWFEATAVDLLESGNLNTGYVANGNQLHPFSWIPRLEESSFGEVCKSTVPGAKAALRWRNLRLPVYSKGLPKPALGNWIDLGEAPLKKSGLETFAVPALVFSRPVTTEELGSFLEHLFIPELFWNRSLEEAPTRFVKSPSIALLETLLDTSLELLAANQFLPAITPIAPIDAWGDVSWRVILSRPQADSMRSLADLGPGEFFSALDSAAKAAKTLAPIRLLQSVLDTLIDADVRRRIALSDFDFDYDDLNSKPLDDIVEALIAPKRDLGRMLPNRGRIPEILAEWRARLLSRIEPAHLALRISPPGYFHDVESNGVIWEVALGLFPAQDRETFLDAADFSASGPELELLKLNPVSAELLFLRKLADSARHSPIIASLLQSSNPTRLFLQPDEVLNFVGGTAALLARTEGAALMLPSVLREAIRPRIKVSTSPASAAPAMLGAEALFSYRTTIHLGDREVSEGEIRSLIKTNAPVVKVGADWIFVDPDGLAKALRFLDRHKGQSEMTLGQLLGDSLGDLDLAGSVEIDRSDPSEIIDSLRFGRAMGIPTFIEPEGFRLPLRDYQKRGVEWLMSLEQLGLGGCLADDMGLGKTAQVIALLAAEQTKSPALESPPDKLDPVSAELIREESKDLAATSATLIVAPVSVVGNWRREFERFFPGLRVRVHHGSRRLEGDEFIQDAISCDVMITSYSLLDRDCDALASVHWRRVVLDEAQNIKNPVTAMARAAQRLDTFSRLALTGTPVENHTGELWSIMNFINPSLLGSRAAFRKRFSIPIEKERDAKVAQHLAKAVSPFILRRLKTDKSIIADLPEKIEVKEYCSLSEMQLELYADTVAKLRAAIEMASDMGRRGAILATITKLKQICNHPAPSGAERLWGRSGKLDRVEELIEEILESGEKVIIFTQFAQFGSLLQRHLQERFSQMVPFLSGSTAITRREEMVSEFQGPAGPSIFLLSLKAGGTGLNLTAANHVIHYDRWWNSAVEAQASDRAFRIGQRKDVVVTKLICEGTLEEKIDVIIESKRELAETLVSGGETWITEMSDEEVFELLTLGASQ